uniref:Uncharacterized protein n=1 Tax=Rhizophora mucronata TaxID=61149 RepID=A0A2P2QAE1_RHIMU
MTCKMLRTQFLWHYGKRNCMVIPMCYNRKKDFGTLRSLMGANHLQR